MNQSSLFSELSKNWWNKNSSLKSLHAINKTRVEYILINSGKLLKNKTLLDVACGGGILTASVANAFRHTTGIDINEKLIAVSKNKIKDMGIENTSFVCEDFFNFDTDETYDFVCLFEIIEHVANPMKLLEKAKSLLSKNGVIYLSCINKTFISKILTIHLAENLGIIPKGTHDFNLYKTPHELKKIIDQLNLNLKDIQGVKYNPLNNIASFSDDTSVNYFMKITK
jgi:2-polyprenyl-6-hydroxyphenyl methylase/3-demethylubiquinone-9 3-methyltransferase